jgi:hypothetical protein
VNHKRGLPLTLTHFACTQIIDASIAQCAAFEVSKMSRENVRAGILGNVERSFSKINNHQNIFQTVTDFNIPRLIPRELLLRIVWRWEDGRSELVSVLDDVTLDNCPEREEYLRMTCSSKMEYKRMENVGGFPQTRVTMTSQTDVGGVIPKWVQTRQGVGVLMYVRGRASEASEKKMQRRDNVLHHASRRLRFSLTITLLQVFKQDAQAVRQELGDRRGEPAAPGDNDPVEPQPVHGGGEGDPPWWPGSPLQARRAQRHGAQDGLADNEG